KLEAEIFTDSVRVGFLRDGGEASDHFHEQDNRYGGNQNGPDESQAELCARLTRCGDRSRIEKATGRGHDAEGKRKPFLHEPPACRNASLALFMTTICVRQSHDSFRHGESTAC